MRDSNLTRRDVLRGMTAMGVSCLAGDALRAQAATGTAHGRRINVHYHLTPPAYVKFLTDNKLREFPNRSLAQGLEDMDRAGVATVVTSIIGPGIWFGDAPDTRRLARECNEYAAKLATDHPGRFGMFAMLPLPDIEGSLREIEYAFDTLKADGVYMFSNFGGAALYGDKYLGDPVLAPVYEELNRRKGIVYVHPKDSACCRGIAPGVGNPTVEYQTDTTRTLVQLLNSGTAAKYSEVTFIFSHGGGVMTSIIGRILGPTAAYLREGGVLAPGAPPPPTSAAMPKGALAELQRFYYDTAMVSDPINGAGLRKIVPLSQILFGTDFPFRNSAEETKLLDDCGVFNERELQAIYRGNAAALLPRFK